ncbi:hypothetical protein [Actinomadura gamaensis]|uniref:Uncharacterized protein n=1 Tax=Actinomadura gamaensis TaxID=1763541 RepID=A0ABV9U836_9ACTN
MPDHSPPTTPPEGDRDPDAARIKAEVDAAPPLSVRQREHLRRIFTAARRAWQRADSDTPAPKEGSGS